MKDSFGKNLLLGLTVTFVFFVLVELILMAAGVTPLYKRTDLSVGFSSYAPLFVKHTEANGEQVYQTAYNKLEWFNMQSFPDKKAAGVTRIFCMGGSTTYGRPYDDRTSFCGWLRLFLPAVDPTRRWEVINAGGISYASYRVARLMEELENYEPDLFIVYSGHNEFLESRTYKKLRKVPRFLRRLMVQASRTRLYTVLYDLTYKSDDVLSEEVDALLDHSVGPEDYHRDDEMREAVLEDYQTSLFRMTNISERAGARLIFVTPASNLADFSPFKSESSQNLSAPDKSRIDTLKGELIATLDLGNYVLAEAIAREALAIDGRDPDLLYLHGQALHALNHMDEARNAFINSRDEDVCPLRALSPTRDMVMDVAKRKKTGLVDFVGIINEHSHDGIPGSEMFLDHVHPTIEGNRLLALAIIEEMTKQGFILPSKTWNEKLIAKISQELENSLDEKTHAIAIRNLSKVLIWAGKHDEAERLANLALNIIPEDSESHIQKGLLLSRSGDKEAALFHFQEAVRLDPWNPSKHHRLGILLSEIGRMDEARTELENTVRLDPELVNVHYDLGVVLRALGKLKEAEAAYRTELSLNSNNAQAHNNLGVILAINGNLTGAFEQFTKAVELDPEYEEAAENLAKAKAVLGE